VGGQGEVIHVLLRLFNRRLVRHPPAPLRIAVLLSAVLAYGTTGFLYFELDAKPELSWADGLWWSVVTMTTIGYGDYFPVSAGGRYLVGLPIMVFGVGLLGYVLSLAAASLVEAKNRELRGMKDFDLEGHFVILNFSRLEKVVRIIDELRHDSSVGPDTEIVLVDEDLTELPQELHARRVHFVRGNPARDETLRRASIDRARHAIILAMTGDARSDDRILAITLAIEAREGKVHTTAECNDIATEELLRKAGCDRIVCASRFDAHFISSEVLNPGIQEAVDELLSTMTGQQLYFSPVASPTDATFERIAKACRDESHIPIGVRRGAKTNLNVPADFVVKKGDQIVTIGAARLRFLDKT